jgi:hypothetical protein
MSKRLQNCRLNRMISGLIGSLPQRGFTGAARMRTEPTLRIPLGILGLFCALLVYGALVARYIAPLIGHWSALVQTPVYVLLGVVWLLPLRRFLIWMETGHLR